MACKSKPSESTSWHGSPSSQTSDSNDHQTIMMPTGIWRRRERRANRKVEGIVWEGYDGLIVPVPAGEPRSQTKPLASTSRRRSRRGLANPDGRMRVRLPTLTGNWKRPWNPSSTSCKTETERRVVEMLVANAKRRTDREALGVSYFHGPRIYRAHRRAVQEKSSTRSTIRKRRGEQTVEKGFDIRETTKGGVAMTTMKMQTSASSSGPQPRSGRA